MDATGLVSLLLLLSHRPVESAPAWHCLWTVTLGYAHLGPWRRHRCNGTLTRNGTRRTTLRVRLLTYGGRERCTSWSSRSLKVFEARLRVNRSMRAGGGSTMLGDHGDNMCNFKEYFKAQAMHAHTYFRVNEHTRNELTQSLCWTTALSFLSEERCVHVHVCGSTGDSEYCLQGARLIRLDRYA
ncbi:uncharacterized protein B0H18DRAFT_28893 [Fomitopsis serialis]|uniref:uncharacterized protein n=1 Tax=Fomitopsis serialis TaxID=139415 RepID=UPI0020075ED3|nr:uncharacterized protein B0H18DRAFT_28893 [Neoantrodia serialis]KAH9932539.1 hypothetical protein B0H18DRAFT_28893 [Neoantrodia serialis]